MCVFQISISKTKPKKQTNKYYAYNAMHSNVLQNISNIPFGVFVVFIVDPMAPTKLMKNQLRTEIAYVINDELRPRLKS